MITRGTRAAVAAALAPSALASPRFSYMRADEEPGEKEEDPSRPFAAHDASRPDEADALGYALRWSRPEDIATVYAQMQAHVEEVGSAGGHQQSHHRRALSTFTDASALAAAARRAATAFRRAPIEPTAETTPASETPNSPTASASGAAATTTRKTTGSHSRPNSQASAHSRPASAAPSSHSRPASAASADAGSADVTATGSPPQPEAHRTTNPRANSHRAGRALQGPESAVPSTPSSPKDQGAAAAAEADGAATRSRSWTLTSAPRHGADVPRHGADVPRHGADVPASPPPPPPPAKPSVLDLWPRRHRRSVSTPA